MRRFILFCFGLVLVCNMGCEGSFTPTGEDIENNLAIVLVEPANNTVCFVQGSDDNQNWLVRFSWALQEGSYNGAYTLSIFDDTGGQVFSETTTNMFVNNVTVPAATRFTWQVTTTEPEEVSDSFVAVSPSARNESSPPQVSPINITKNQDDFSIEFSILDPDSDFLSSELFINDISQGIFGDSVSYNVDLPDGEVVIRLNAVDEAGNQTEVTRVYNNI